MAPSVPLLISETTALVPPLIIPAPKPKIKMDTFKRSRDVRFAMPSKPINIARHARININLYPNLSQTGPNSNDPASIPIGRIEKSVPADKLSK